MKRCDQGREPILGCIPHSVQIEIPVTVDKPVTHPNHATPGDLRMRVFEFLRNAPCRLTNDLNLVYNAVLEQ